MFLRKMETPFAPDYTPQAPTEYYYPSPSTPAPDSELLHEPYEGQESHNVGYVHLSIESDAQPVPSSRTRGPYGKRISKDQELLIFKRCLQHTKSYEIPEERKRKFWVIVSKSLEADVGRLYAWNTIKKRVDDRVLERRVHLEQVETGDPREPQTDLEAAIDEWIEVLDRVAAEIEESQAAAKKIRDDVAKSSEYRDGLTRRMGKKRDKSRVFTQNPDSLPTGLENFEDLPMEFSQQPEDPSREPSPEPTAASRFASRSGSRSVSRSTPSTSRRDSSSRSAPYSSRRPRRPRPDDDESQLLRQTLIKVADSLMDSQSDRRETLIEERVKTLEKRMDSQNEKLDKILDILSGRQ